MIFAADITVIAPDFYTSPYNTRYLRASAARHNVPIHWYGTGESYRGWLYTQIERLHDEIDKIGTNYVLYTDSSDAIFLASLNEIALKLERDHRRPEILMSVEADGQVCAGGWLARTGTALDALKWLGNFSFDGDDGNPQTRWREAIEDGEIEVERDLLRSIFVTVCDGGLAHDAELMRPKYDTVDPITHPCLLHFAGGYTDPATGKSELIEPVWRQLGYEATV